METRKFEYSLPKELIAQEPIEPRDSSRLLVLERKKKSVREDVFRNVIDYFNPGDVLVLNDTKVIPARIQAYKATGGKVEVFLLKKLGESRWEALVKPGRRVPPGSEVMVGEGIPIKIIDRTTDGTRIIEFSSPETSELVIRKFGQIPLPPYIKKPLSDPSRYQTIYAKKEGSVAAPTAALHFTPQLLRRIEDKGIDVVYITLHMGWGSFQPIREETIEAHKLPSEYYTIPELVAKRINKAKKEGKKIIACGTDVVRAMETQAKEGKLEAGSGSTSLFITPGYKFKVVDTLITNLHLPRSSHLVLVSAFAGREFVFKAYQYAVERRFRFYTFGDATIVL